MAKGQMNRDSSAEPQPRVLRTRKRKHQSDDVLQTDEVTTEENTTEVAPPQPPLSTLQDDAVDQPCLIKQEDPTDVKQTEDTNVSLTDVAAVKGKEESSVTISSNSSELEGSVNTDTGTNPIGMEETTTAEGVTPPSPDQLQVLSPTPEADGGSSKVAPEKQLEANETSHCDPERIHESSHEETSDTCTADVKEVPKEAVVGLPANKKRRMGMCNLTEKERSHFLQAQKRENGLSRAQGTAAHLCDDDAGELVAQEQTSSSLAPSSPATIPADCITEQSEAETLEYRHRGGNDRTETEVQVTHSDEVSTACDPVGPEAKREAEPEPCAESESHPLTQKQQELKRGTTEASTETTKAEGDGSREADGDNAVKEKSEGNEKEEAAGLQVNTESRTHSKLEDDVVADAPDETEAAWTPSTVNAPVESNSDAAATPTGSERKGHCDVEDAPRPVAAAQTWTRTTTTDLFGSGYLDYVSDSQLNTIVLNDDDMREREKNPGSSDGPEDATDLIRGLIRELSSINRKVMSTHRELENLQRGSKTSKRFKH